MLTLGLTLVASACLVVLGWLFVSTRAALVSIIGATTVLVTHLFLTPLPTDPIHQIPLVIGVAVGVAVVLAGLYVGAVLTTALAIRGIDACVSRLLDPYDSDENPITGRPETIVKSLLRLRKWLNRVNTDYFRPGERIVGSDPVYFRLLQRRAYFHADPDTVNYNLQWLDDHFAHSDDDDAREHVKELQRELDADELWSP